MKLKDLIEITWVDSSTTEGWRFTDTIDFHDDLIHTIRTVGFLIKKDDKYISVTHSYQLKEYDDGSFCAGSFITIPMVSVKKIKKIKSSGR